ncbi:hypothetical protein [Sphingobacterium yanglingense]|uniref:Uncharacterized protein n=1 Tax=Sphingobacterium yanglingense TaxID=1437280 RepID=A0A4R6WS97_9SPHI|nr:hypothetical protein [Sphingobacterium yanglingense]TDQ79556.1 hypothetical protein CLV99_0999 [Sphingobacterium yanglingense]
MKSIRITHERTATTVSPLFHFNHPDGELEDFEQVLVIPVDGEGQQFLEPEIRTVVKVGQPIDGISQYEGSIHVNP